MNCGKAKRPPKPSPGSLEKAEPAHVNVCLPRIVSSGYMGLHGICLWSFVRLRQLDSRVGEGKRVPNFTIPRVLVPFLVFKKAKLPLSNKTDRQVSFC